MVKNPHTGVDDKGQPSQHFDYVLTDQQTGITLSANSKDDATRISFAEGPFNRWVAENRIPLVIIGAGHANILLKGPHQDGENRWVITTHDPMSQREHDISLKEQLSLDQWIEQSLKTGKIAIDKEATRIATSLKQLHPERYKLSNSLTKGQTRQQLFQYYFKDLSPLSIPSIYLTEIYESLYDGSYNLSIAYDPEIPDEVKEAINQATQTGLNCIPLSFVSGLARLLVLRENPQEQRRIADIVKRDFGITLLTREEILAGLKTPIT